MSLLKPATKQLAFLKAGVFGFEGSGKTYLSVELAIGITKLTKGTKVAFFDTETGSDFHIDKFKKDGIELYTHKGRAFQDLCQIIRDSESQGFSALIIDSTTHVWREFVQAFLTKRKKEHLSIKDWGTLKKQWQEFTDLYVNSKLHIIMAGRAGYEYEANEDEDTGKTEFQKSGTKMKVEGETGFEPSILVEMIKVPKAEGSKRKKERGIVNRCFVIKDRSDTLNGKFIDYPKFKDFMPHIKSLNIGGEHVGVDTSRTSEGVFNDPDWSVADRQRRRDIALEDLQTVLLKAGLDGRSEEVRLKRANLLEDVFGKASKTHIENLNIEKLEKGVEQIKLATGQDDHAQAGLELPSEPAKAENF